MAVPLRPYVVERFMNIPKDKTAGDVWEDLWHEKQTAWDRGTHNPALEDTLMQKTSILGNPLLPPASSGVRKRRKALVPGCGRGVDVFLLASFGYDAFGLEYSKTALEVCRKEAAKYGDKGVAPRNEKIGSGMAIFLQGDFFDNSWLKEAGFQEGEFDIIYDYSFFCALNPSMRPQWALRHTQLLAPSPRGNLICLEFPTTKEPAAGGPPFASPPAAYMEHLSHPGEEVPYDEEGQVKSNPLREVSKKGLERVAHYHPERTHAAGMNSNGTVEDWVSIWRRR